MYTTYLQLLAFATIAIAAPAPEPVAWGPPAGRPTQWGPPSAATTASAVAVGYPADQAAGNPIIAQALPLTSSQSAVAQIVPATVITRTTLIATTSQATLQFNQKAAVIPQLKSSSKAKVATSFQTVATAAQQVPANNPTTVVSTQGQPKKTATSAAAATTPDSSGGGSGDTAPGGSAIFHFVNKFGKAINMGGAKSGVIGVGETSTMTIQQGGGGQSIAFAVEETDGNGSLFEWNYPSGAPLDIDVSYVNGYTVPMTCSCKATNTPLSGCSVELFSYKWGDGSANECPCAEVNGACPNPIRPIDVDGLIPNAFFQPCQARAFTYPRDPGNANGLCDSNVIECCIGSDAQGCPSRKSSVGSTPKAPYPAANAYGSLGNYSPGCAISNP